LREYAAAAFGVLGKNLNDAEDIAALESALETEERTEVVAALVKALMDAGPDGGARAAAALGRVDLWTRFNLALRLDGGGSRELADLLTEAGVIDRISDSDLPETTGDKWDLLGLLLAGGERLVVMDVKGDDVPPHHHALCRDLLRIARPRIAVENLSQSHNDNYERTPVPGSAAVIREIDLGTACIVRFTYEGKEHEFAAHPSGRWLDVASVMSGFNAFMAAIGRDDRCFELLGEGSYVFLIVAPASKFLPLAQRLQIPLESDSEGARDAAKAYAGQIRRTYSLNSGDAS
jgi:hypothetical protein